MYCPKCKAEYREGFTVCADCKVPLIKELPPEPPKPGYIEYEEVLSTSNHGDVAIIKSILNSEGIVYFFKGERFNMLRPEVQPAILLVDKEKIERVKELLKDLDLIYTLKFNTKNM